MLGFHFKTYNSFHSDKPVNKSRFSSFHLTWNLLQFLKKSSTGSYRESDELIPRLNSVKEACPENNASTIVFLLP